MDPLDLGIVVGWTVVWLMLVVWIWIIPAEGFQRLSVLRGAPWVVVIGVKILLSVAVWSILLVVGWPPVPPFATLWGSAG
jgi:hypothetical protein